MMRGAFVSAAIMASLLSLALAAQPLIHKCSMSYEPLLPPSSRHPLGTDPVGRDALCELVAGIGASVEAGFAALASSLLVLFASLAAGVSDKAGRLVDSLAALGAGLPRMSLLMMLALVTRLSPVEIGLLIGFLASLQGARAAATRARQVARSLYVEAARAIGAPRHRIVLRHIAPNSWSSIASYASIASSAAVYAEAGLSMLGLGSPATPSLGKVASLVLLTPGAILTEAGLAQLLAALATVAILALLVHEAVSLLSRERLG